MSNDTIYIYDHESGLEKVREMTDAEQAIRNTEVAEAETVMAAEQAAIVQAEADKVALLARLGITKEEAALLLGGTN